MQNILRRHRSEVLEELRLTLHASKEGTIPRPLLRDALLEGLKDGNPEVRAEAIGLLAHVFKDESLPHIQAFLTLLPPSNFIAAVDAISGLESAASKTLLVRACKKLLRSWSTICFAAESNEMAIHVVSALARRRDEKLMPLFKQCTMIDWADVDAATAKNLLLGTKSTSSFLTLMAMVKRTDGEIWGEVLRNDLEARRHFLKLLYSSLGNRSRNEQCMKACSLLTGPERAWFLVKVCLHGDSLSSRNALTDLRILSARCPGRTDGLVHIAARSRNAVDVETAIQQLSQEKVLGTRGGRYVRGLLERLEQSGGMDLCAAIALGWIRGDGLEPALLDIIERSRDLHTCDAALRALMRNAEDQRGRVPLVHHLLRKMEKHGELRQWCMYAMGTADRGATFCYLMCKAALTPEKVEMAQTIMTLCGLGREAFFEGLIYGMEHLVHRSERELVLSICRRLRNDSGYLRIDSDRSDPKSERVVFQALDQILLYGKQVSGLKHLDPRRLERRYYKQKVLPQMLQDAAKRCTDDFVREDWDLLSRRCFSDTNASAQKLEGRTTSGDGSRVPLREL